MVKIEVPGFRMFELEHLVLDFNGTLACDGSLLPGVREILEELSRSLTVHVLTADTFGRAKAELEGISCRLTVLPKQDQARGKQRYVEDLGVESVVSVGNGRNDGLMLEKAALGIIVFQEEGMAVESALRADVACPDITSALGLLTRPLRLAATLRS